MACEDDVNRLLGDLTLCMYTKHLRPGVHLSSPHFTIPALKTQRLASVTLDKVCVWGACHLPSCPHTELVLAPAGAADGAQKSPL